MTDKGFADQVKGKIKETVGDVTKDSSLKADGLVDQVVGKTKEVVSDVKDAVVEIAEKAKDAINSNKDK